MFKNWKIDKEKKRYLWKERVELSINAQQSENSVSL